MKYSKYSAVVVGSGISGLFCALKIAQQINLPEGLLVVTKSNFGESNSRYAQGGIVGVMNDNPKDSVELHIKDTIRAGAGLSEHDTIKFISENSNQVINDLIEFGVEFDKDENGNIAYTLEGAHSINRILHAGGDATGSVIEKTLCKRVKENPNIDILEDTIVTELLVDSDGECKGAIIYNDDTQEYETIYSSAMILASGGIGQLYKYTTNPLVATGDGIELAYQAGAILQDLEFVQFHPTALAVENAKNRFLISESVRGEGAKLLDKNNSEFMSEYSELKELAPRDVVTRAIYDKMIKSNSPNVYLDATIIPHNMLLKRFPTISKVCKSVGIDITKSYIPVAPAAHYYMGGIKTTIDGRTSIRGLYAIGECASTGLHGANRLASNSLLECVVCAHELANYLSFTSLVPPKKIDESIMETIDKYTKPLSDESFNISELKSRLKELMWNYAGILRDENLLLKGLDEIYKLKSEFRRNTKCLNKQEYELRNMLCVAQLIIKSALKREESRGAHYRTDFPKTDEKGIHNCIIKGEGEPSFVK
ncbi:MAG: L-aspartate oxidase [Candidatus Gastranaerophilales bacterium]|nr:L-aspartate oxidase [Candidatus Gastranaerophilales bacterium]